MSLFIDRVNAFGVRTIRSNVAAGVTNKTVSKHLCIYHFCSKYFKGGNLGNVQIIYQLLRVSHL
jgi:hypothetical protein